MRVLVKKFQKELKEKNLYHGKIDGDFGPLTFAGAQSYFNPNGLIPPWMSWVGQELGISELQGEKKNNPRIIHYHSFTGLGAKTDEVPWCASFVNAALLEGAGIHGTGSAVAASFRTYGRQSNPRSDYGSVTTIKTNTGSKRHVFFNSGYFDGHVFGAGGNQSNKVNVVAYPIEDIIDSRLPN